MLRFIYEFSQGKIYQRRNHEENKEVPTGFVVEIVRKGYYVHDPEVLDLPQEYIYA